MSMFDLLMPVKFESEFSFVSESAAELAPLRFLSAGLRIPRVFKMAGGMPTETNSHRMRPFFMGIPLCYIFSMFFSIQRASYFYVFSVHPGFRRASNAIIDVFSISASLMIILSPVWLIRFPARLIAFTYLSYARAFCRHLANRSPSLLRIRMISLRPF